MELFISVDVEASGPIPGEYSLLQIGACAIGRPAPSFDCLLKPISDRSVPEALAITGLDLDNLARIGRSPAEAMGEFESWILATAGSKRPVMVGLNAPFDWSFINYYFHRFLGRNPFGISALDIKSAYLGATGCTWADTGAEQIAKNLLVKGRGDHNALNDALFQAELFRKVRLLTNSTDC